MMLCNLESFLMSIKPFSKISPYLLPISSSSVDFVLVFLMIIYFPDDYFIKKQLGKELRTHVASDAKWRARNLLTASTSAFDGLERKCLVIASNCWNRSRAIRSFNLQKRGRQLLLADLLFLICTHQRISFGISNKSLIGMQRSRV